MIIFTDEVIEGIKRDIASHAPERGGALLGPQHTNLVSCFLFDPQAKTTAASYSPSKQLIETVKIEELATGLTFKGIVHSLLEVWIFRRGQTSWRLPVISLPTPAWVVS